MSDILEKYPSPRDNKGFIRYWDSFLPDILERDNLKPSHLKQLEILCDLYLEYDQMTEILDMGGFTYESYGRNGKQIKMRPEVSHRKSLIASIKDYSKLLGLTLFKDTQTTKKEEENEFN